VLRGLRDKKAILATPARKAQQVTKGHKVLQAVKV
jgi:hypothetical protein